jgi:5-methylcytosine-specific restriction endonuclease McrA
MVRGFGVRFIKGHGFKGKHQGTAAKLRISATHSGEFSYMWKGDQITKESGNCRAIRMYPSIGTCQRCKEKQAVDRHHRDGNTANNNPENVLFLCRRCHILIDGRLKNLKPFMNGRNIPVEETTCTMMA